MGRNYDCWMSPGFSREQKWTNLLLIGGTAILFVIAAINFSAISDGEDEQQLRETPSPTPTPTERPGTEVTPETTPTDPEDCPSIVSHCPSVNETPECPVYDPTCPDTPLTPPDEKSPTGTRTSSPTPTVTTSLDKTPPTPPVSGGQESDGVVEFGRWGSFIGDDSNQQDGRIVRSDDESVFVIRGISVMAFLWLTVGVNRRTILSILTHGEGREEKWVVRGIMGYGVILIVGFLLFFVNPRWTVLLLILGNLLLGGFCLCLYTLLPTESDA